MSDSEEEPAGSDVSDDDEDKSEPGFDLASALENMSDADRKKWDKSAQSWRIYLDFLFRHIAIVTFKYNCFEREDLLPFMMALEKAEDLKQRSLKTKKRGDPARIQSIRDMKEAADLLTKSNCLAEAVRLRRYLDLNGRMKGLATIATSFYKTLKKGKVAGLERLKRYVDFWKGFCVRSFDFAQLSFINVDEASLNDLERRYLAWPTVIRTSLNLAERFLKRVCDSTGLRLISNDPATMQKHMQAAEYVLAAKMEEVLFDRGLEDTRTIGLLQGIGSLHFSSKDDSLNFPSLENVDPVLLKPIPDSGLLLELPPEPPKEKKLKKKGKGKKGSRSISAGSHKGRKKKK